MRRLSVAFGAICLFPANAPAAEPAPVYSVTRVGSSLDDDERVGVKRAGLACLGNGALRWRDVGGGDRTEQREIVQDALEDAGIAVTPLGEVAGGGAAGRRIRGSVRAAAFALCAKHWGLGDAKAYSGTASLDVEWRVERRDGSAESPHLSHVERAIEPAHSAPIGAIYRHLLNDAALDLAHWLRGDPPR